MRRGTPIMTQVINPKLLKKSLLIVLLFTSSMTVRLDASTSTNTTLTETNVCISGTYTKNGTVYHSNGTVMTRNASDPNAKWYYNNGQLLTNSVGKQGSTWYWKNGTVFSFSMGKKGAKWYFEDGKVMTYSAPALNSDQMRQMACNIMRENSGNNKLDFIADLPNYNSYEIKNYQSEKSEVNNQIANENKPSTNSNYNFNTYINTCYLLKNGNGETLYYPDGSVLTFNAGHQGATVYYKNGNILTHYMGVKGSKWYWSNGKVLSFNLGEPGAKWYFEDGKVKTYDGAELDSNQMYNMACRLLGLN